MAVIRSNPRSRSQVEPCDFCVRRGIFSRLGGKDGHKCPFKDSNVVTLMLTTPWRVSGGHPLLTLFDQNPPPIGIATLACGLGYSTLRKKIPRVHLVPLNVGYTATPCAQPSRQAVSFMKASPPLVCDHQNMPRRLGTFSIGRWATAQQRPAVPRQGGPHPLRGRRHADVETFVRPFPKWLCPEGYLTFPGELDARRRWKNVAMSGGMEVKWA
jgi:hypothetical protein